MSRAEWVTAARRGLVSFGANAAPAVEKYKPVGTARADRDPATVKLLRSREALAGRLTYTSPPSRARFSTYPEVNLEPSAIWSIMVQRNNGYPQLWADLCEGVLGRDGHLGGIYETRRLGVADKPFRIHPVRQGDGLAETIADFTSRVIEEIDNFDQAIEDLLSACAYGYAISELVWSVDHPTPILLPVGGGRTVNVMAAIPRIDWVPWKHVRFDLDTDEPFIWLKDGEYRLAPNKFIFHSASGTGVTVKRGFMDSCVWLSAAKSWTQRDWLIYSKLRSIPHIHGTYPDGEQEYDIHRAFYEQLLKDYGEGIPALVPNSLKIEHGPEPAGRATDIQGSIIGWANTEMSKRILGSTLTVEVSGQGAWAAADTHRDAPFMRARADARKAAATLRGDLLRAIVDVNIAELQRALSKQPDELLGAAAKCSWRIEREMSTADRLNAWSKGVEMGIDLDEDQFLDEYGFNRPSKYGRAIKGKAIPVPSGGALINEGAVAAADGKPITSPTADAKVEADADGKDAKPQEAKPTAAHAFANWNEGDHPRNGGKFAPKGGGDGGAAPDAGGDSPKSEAAPSTDRAAKPRKPRPFRLKSTRAPRPKQPADPNAPPKPPREYHRDHLGRFRTKPAPDAAQLTLPTKLPTIKKDGQVKPDPKKVPGGHGAWPVRVSNDPENSYKGRSYAMKNIAAGVAEFMAAPCSDPKIDGYLGQTPRGGWTNRAVIEAVTGRSDQKLWDDLSIQTDRKGSRKITSPEEAVAAVMPIAMGTRSKRDWRDFDLATLQGIHPAFAAMSLPQWLHDADNDKRTEEYYREQAEAHAEKQAAAGEDSNKQLDESELPDYGGHEEYQTYDHKGDIDDVPF